MGRRCECLHMLLLLAVVQLLSFLSLAASPHPLAIPYKGLLLPKVTWPPQGHLGGRCCSDEISVR